MLGGLRPGLYTVNAKKEGYIDISSGIKQSHKAMARPGSTTRITITLAEKGSIWDQQKVSIESNDGKPDLVMEDVYLNQMTGVPQLVLSVKNIGEVNVPADTSISLNIERRVLGTHKLIEEYPGSLAMGSPLKSGKTLDLYIGVPGWDPIDPIAPSAYWWVVHIDPDKKPDPDSPPGSSGAGHRTPGTQVSGGRPSPPSPPPGPKGPNQGGPVVTGPKPLEPESQPTLPVPRTDPPWINRMPGYEYPPYGNGVGFGAGGGGDLGLPAPDEYCEYRIVYFGSRIVDDLGENRKALHNAIKWAAKHPTTLWNTTVLLMPSWGGYEGWDDYWDEFATEYPDVILLRWSDLQDQRKLVIDEIDST